MHIWAVPSPGSRTRSLSASRRPSKADGQVLGLRTVKLDSNQDVSESSYKKGNRSCKHSVMHTLRGRGCNPLVSLVTGWHDASWCSWSRLCQCRTGCRILHEQPPWLGACCSTHGSLDWRVHCHCCNCCFSCSCCHYPQACNACITSHESGHPMHLRTPPLQNVPGACL